MPGGVAGYEEPQTPHWPTRRLSGPSCRAWPVAHCTSHLGGRLVRITSPLGVESSRSLGHGIRRGPEASWLIPGSGRTATRGLDKKKAHPLFVDPPSDMSMSCTRRAEFESAAFRRLPDESSAFVAFRTPPPTDQKSLITLSTSNTTTAHTQMDLPFVGVQGHQKPLENTKTLMKIGRFPVSGGAEPGVYRGGSAPPPRDH